MNRSARFRILLTGVCCACIAIGAPAALAQKQAAGEGAAAQPKGGWAVTRIDESQAQGGAYCTLARQYDNNVIFSIGRNKAEEYSLAVDFQESRFETGKPYDITLKAGNQTRQVQLMAASPRALVIRLGWDDSFFDALEKAQGFSVGVEGKSYAFAMPDYAKGKKDIAGCMATLKTADGAAAAGNGGSDVLAAESGIGAEKFGARKVAQGGEAAPAPRPPSARPERTIIDSLETPEIAGLADADRAAYVPPMRSTDLRSLEEENIRLRDALTEQRQGYEARLSDTADQTNQLAELREKLRLAEMRGGSAASTAAAATTGAVLAAAPTATAKPDPAQAQKIAELEKTVAGLRQQLAAQNDLTMSAAPTPLPDPEQARHITVLQQEVTRLRDALKEAEAKQAVVAAAPAPAVERADAGADEPRAFSGELASLRREVQNKEAQMRSVQARNQAQQEEISGLRRQLGALQRQAGSVESNDAELARLKQENASLRNRVSEARSASARAAATASSAAIASAQMPRAPHDAPVASSLTPVPVTAAPLPPAADLAAMAPAAAPSVAAPVAAPSSALQSALQRAGVTARRGGADGYEWDNGPVRGKARAARGGNALAASQSYMNAQRNACAGDFAAVPGNAASGRVSVDIACIDAMGGKAQSLLFTEQGGEVLTFILESSAENMDNAMDARDRLGARL